MLLAGTRWCLVDYDQARQYLEESIAVSRRLGDVAMTALALSYKGAGMRWEGIPDEAETILREALSLLTGAALPVNRILPLNHLCRLALDRGDLDRATELLAEGLELARAHRDEPGTIFGLVTAGRLADARGDPARAVEIFAALEALNDERGAVWMPLERADIERAISAARGRLTDEAFTAAWAAGRSLSLDQAAAMAEALAGEPSP